MPSGPWVMAQSWYDLLFAHWPVPADAMQALLPEGLELDTWQGEAWVGVVPFGMCGVRPRFVPSVPWLSRFLELNVRTYVTLDGKPGVYFFSLDAANPVAVSVARATFHLPYFNADMSLTPDSGGSPATDDATALHYLSQRTHSGAPPSRFEARYRPTGPVYASTPDTLEHWLTERYCLYAVRNDGSIWRGDIHHIPWPLQAAEAELIHTDLCQGHNIPRADTAPLLHFCRRIDTVVWLIERVR